MRKEDADKIKCDRCGGVIGLFQHDHGWRCPRCIWNEREIMLEALTACYDYFASLEENHGQMVSDPQCPESTIELTKAALLLKTHRCTECSGHGRVRTDRTRGYEGTYKNISYLDLGICPTCDGKGVEKE